MYHEVHSVLFSLLQQAVTVSEKGSVDFRSFLSLNEVKISPWHDLSLVAGKSETGDYVFNYVNEIPRGYEVRFEFLIVILRESYKFEMSKEEKGNPVKHDMKDGKIR